MTGWIVLAVYVTGWAWASRKAAVLAADHFDENESNTSATDRFLTRLLGFLAGTLWPVVFPVLLFTWRLPKTPKQAKAEREQMKRRIAELERELNIR